MTNQKSRDRGGVVFYCDWEGSAFTIDVVDDELNVAHVAEAVDTRVLKSLTYVSSSGVDVFSATSRADPTSDTCPWDVYSIGQDIFCEFPSEFVGTVWSLVSAFKLVSFVLDNFAPTAPPANNLRDESE